MQDTRITMLESVRLLAPTLRVRDLQASLSFYNDIGLRSKKIGTDQDGLEAYELGLEGSPLVILRHDPDARPPLQDSAGLYHYAILLPTRKSLATTFLAIGNSGIPYDGFVDHLVSEALYLHDEERNGIEIYTDRPKETWPNWKQLTKAAEDSGDYGALAASMSMPLDLNSILKELSQEERNAPLSFPDGAKIGHFHLKVTDLQRSVEFYQKKLGFDVNVNLQGMGAAFLSVGGYHHQIGLNTWHSLDGSPLVGGTTGLEEIAFKVPKLFFEELERTFPSSLADDSKLAIKDPDGIKIVIKR